MTKEQEIEQSQKIELPPEFFSCLQNGIIPVVQYANDKVTFDKMSATIITQTWNASRFLPMLFESFYEMDRNNIDTQFIITDAGSDEDNKSQILELLEAYKNKLNILFLYHNVDEQRNIFNNNHPDGTFHSFPFITNSALKYAEGDVFINCDSSNIVDKEWVRGLCSLHYMYPEKKLVVKSRCADFTAESTLSLEGKYFDYSYFTLPHDYHEFTAGTGCGFSAKIKNVNMIGGFNNHFSCCGAVDDEFIYRMIKDGGMFIGNKPSFAIHRTHKDGYDPNKNQKKRLPDWGYKELKKMYIDAKSPMIIQNNDDVVPLEVHKNY